MDEIRKYDSTRVNSTNSLRNRLLCHSPAFFQEYGNFSQNEIADLTRMMNLNMNRLVNVSKLKRQIDADGFFRNLAGASEPIGNCLQIKTLEKFHCTNGDCSKVNVNAKEVADTQLGLQDAIRKPDNKSYYGRSVSAIIRNNRKTTSELKCEECQQFLCRVQTFQEPLPPVLMIQLKRFQIVQNVTSKLTKKVLADPSLVLNNTKYFQKCVISHTGDASGGHYICSMKRPRNTWRVCDDDKISDQNIEPDEGYLFFYEIQDKESLPPKVTEKIPAVTPTGIETGVSNADQPLPQNVNQDDKIYDSDDVPSPERPSIFQRVRSLFRKKPQESGAKKPVVTGLKNKNQPLPQDVNEDDITDKIYDSDDVPSPERTSGLRRGRSVFRHNLEDSSAKMPVTRKRGKQSSKSADGSPTSKRAKVAESNSTKTNASKANTKKRTRSKKAGADKTSVSPQKKRGRGRPRKEVDPANVKCNLPKKKVGRPRKEVDPANVKSNLPKKKPGRPRKEVDQANVKEKKKRGRPKKSVDNAGKPKEAEKVLPPTAAEKVQPLSEHEAQVLNAQVESQYISDVVREDIIKVLEKRKGKRGRPKKLTVEEEDQAEKLARNIAYLTQNRKARTQLINRDQSYLPTLTTDNAFLTTALKEDDKFEDEVFKLPDQACSVCEERWYGMKVGPRNKKCQRCAREKAGDINKFSRQNYMIPSSIPNCIARLTQVEINAIKIACPILHFVVR